MSDTIETKLDKCNPNDVLAFMRKLNDPTTGVGFGGMLAAMRPRNRTRTVASSTTQIHDVAAVIYSVESPVGTPLAIVSGGTAGAGECSVDYDAVTGVPTLEFAGAVTTYTVSSGGPLPQTLAANMAALV